MRETMRCNSTPKYERGLPGLMHDDLLWLVIPKRVQYKPAVKVHRCLRHRAPKYLPTVCRSPKFLVANICDLPVPRVRRSTIGTRAFSVARLTIWNSLPDHLWDPAVYSEQFRRDLKTYLFTGHPYVSASEVFT